METVRPSLQERKLVSICVPTCNRLELLQRSISTILAQDYEPLEILIADNASTDGTEAYCWQLSRSDNRVRYIRRAENIGIYQNHNLLIEESRGEYVCFQHDDDEYDPHLIQEEAAFLSQHPEAGLVSPDWTLMDESGNRLGSRSHRVPHLQEGLVYIEQTLRSGRSSVGLSGTMIRRTALASARFDENGPIGFGDFVLWFEIAERWKIGHIPKPLYAYRLHTKSLSRRSILSITEDYQKALFTYCRQHLARCPDHSSMTQRWRRLIERYLFWMLAYEICLHYSHHKKSDGHDPSQFRTIFELMDYRLSPQEFEEVLVKWRSVRAGWIESLSRQAIQSLIYLGWTQPLAGVAPYAPALRRALGLLPPTSKEVDFAPAFSDSHHQRSPAAGEGMPLQDIVCISSIDWDFIWQGHQEIMSALAAQGHRVLFIENTGIRSVNWSDLPRLRKRLSRWRRSIRGFRQEKPNLYVCSPLGLPFPYSWCAQMVNRLLIIPDLHRWMRVMQFDNPIVWSFLPTPLAMDLIRAVNPKLVIYYCIDNFAAGSSSAKKIQQVERRMFQMADMVFVTSEQLFQYASHYSNHVHRFPFGVNFELFEQARNHHDRAEPEDIRTIPAPRIGYVGGIHRWVDLDLVRDLARRRPDLHFVLVGPLQTNVSRLNGLSNVHLLGSKPHSLLPDYIRGFNVCMIPYRLTDYTDNVYPTKLNEYLAMGKPVVSTPLKEVSLFNQRHGPLVAIGATPTEFDTQMDAILGQREDHQAQRIAVARENSWQVKTKRMADLIEQRMLEQTAAKELDWQEKFLTLYRKTRQKLVATIASTLLLVMILFYSPLPWFVAAPLVQTDIPRQADTIVVLAAGVGESGKAGQGYEERVKRAVELYQAGYAKRMIFSSGYVHLFHEPQVMKALALSLGIPAEAILLETKSVNTHENVLNVSKILEQNGWHSILLVSSPYHMRRASMVFARLEPWVQVIRTPAENSYFYVRRIPGMTPGQLHGIAHEYLALVSYWFKGWV